MFLCDRTFARCPDDFDPMTTIRVTGQIDSTNRLTATLPAGVPAGPVEVVVMLPAPSTDAGEQGWLEGIAREWRDDLADYRQDIYSPTDGRPPHEAG